MRSVLVITSILLQGVLPQTHFSSILIERACRKRPSLDFCAELQAAPETQATKERAVPEAIQTTFSPSLVTPPSLETNPGEPIVVKTIEPGIRLILPPKPVEREEKSIENMKPEIQIPSNNTSEEKVEFGEEVREEPKEQLGSLLRLPKPRIGDPPLPMIPALLPNGAVTVVPVDTKSASHEEGSKSNNSITKESIEDGKHVLVFVSEYCVINREKFVKRCHGEVEEPDMPFCKSYPSACASTAGVIPVISYCQRYYRQYPILCTAGTVQPDAMQFCFAFEQFCLPELTPATQSEKVAPRSSLKKCSDVLPEARKVCNPFPSPKDTFNVLRCTQFLTNCRKFVDWA